MKILIIEDETALLETVKQFLEKERNVVETAPTLREALEKVSVYDYECILLDIMLPDGNGLSFLQKLKEMHKSDSVIIISAKDSVDDKVAGLDLGADDYLSKPFHLSELNARIRSLVRRNRNNGEPFIELDNMRIIPDKFEVSINGKTLDLNRKEYDILHYFSTRPNRLINKAVLAEAVWGDCIDQTDNFDFIYAQIKNLRKKLNDAGANVEIKAVYGFGYKLIVEEK
ncbi:MAG: response regulator transcription factor [Prevotellaceae bacterium]|jgi:DNA-binding response OmpR family regulator|nr:response regulator transcription factor [Prevotellaceae bacterium]